MKLISHSIRNRIIWPVVAILLVTFVVLAASLHSLKAQLQQDLVVNEYAEYYEHLLALSHTEETARPGAYLQGVASDPNLSRSVAQSNTATVRSMLTARSQDFAQLGLSEVLIVSADNTVLGHYSQGQQQYVYSPFTSLPHYGVLSSANRLFHVAAVPIVHNGRQVGSLVGLKDFAKFLPRFQEKTMASAIYIYSPDGKLLVGTENTDSLEVAPNIREAAFLGNVAYEIQDGGRQLVVFYPVSDHTQRMVGLVKLAFDISIYAEVFSWATRLVSVIFLLAPLIMVGALLVVLKVILKPVKEVVRVSALLSGGDLAARVGSSTQDEIGTIALAFDKMGQSFEGIIIRLQEATSSLAQSLDAVSLASQQVAAGSQQQSYGANNILNMSSKIAEAARDINEQAKIARALVEAALKRALSGKQTLGQAETVARDVSREVALFRDKSVQIAEMSDLIRDVSDQTALLSLNAAIEAARAGEAGRGFAVVADEVRKLADKTAAATKDITLLVKSIEEQISSVTNSTVHLTAATNEVVQVFEGIASDLHQNVAVVNEIAQAVQSQASFANEVVSAVEGVAAVVEQNSAAVQENTSMIEEMRSLAHGIEREAGIFKTSKAR